MTRLEIISSLVMDAYYQSYAKESDFLQQEDFAQYTSMFFQQVLQEDFDKTRREMLQMGILEMGDSPILSDAWYKVKEVEVIKEGENYFINMPTTFSFNRDVTYSGLKAIYPSSSIGDCCGKFSKIKIDQCESLKFLPKSDKTIYYFPLGDKVYFKRVECGLKKVNVAYIPNLNDTEDNETNVSIPEGLIAEIVTRTYNFLTAARNGSVIDKTNNQNPNKIIQTEIDSQNQN